MTTKTKKRVQVRPNVHAMMFRLPLDLHAELREHVAEGTLTHWLIEAARERLSREKSKKS